MREASLTAEGDGNCRAVVVIEENSLFSAAFHLARTAWIPLHFTIEWPFVEKRFLLLGVCFVGHLCMRTHRSRRRSRRQWRKTWRRCESVSRAFLPPRIYLPFRENNITEGRGNMSYGGYYGIDEYRRDQDVKFHSAENGGYGDASPLHSPNYGRVARPQDPNITDSLCGEMRDACEGDVCRRCAGRTGLGEALRGTW